MKTNSIIALILSISLFGLFGCADKYEVDYEAPVKIEFAGVDQNNRVSLTKGIAEYTATVKVQGEIMSFEIYQADSKTGMQGSLIEETAQSFADGTTNYETTYKFTSLKENACITVVVLGTDGHTYQRNLLVEITPSVLFSDPDYGKDGEIVETASAYYGCYYATWLLGRTYMAADAMKYTNEIVDVRVVSTKSIVIFISPLTCALPNDTVDSRTVDVVPWIFTNERSKDVANALISAELNPEKALLN